MKRARLSVLVTGVILSSAGTAHAQPAQVKATAEVLFEEGKGLMRQKKYAEACPKFLESNRLDAGLGTMLWLADCYEKNGQSASAWGQFREAAEIAARERDPREKVARERASRIEPTLTTLTILVDASAAASGLKVQRDGDDVDPPLWGVGVPVDPGAHKIMAVAPHKLVWDSTVDVRARNVQVAIPPLEDVPPERVAPPVGRRASVEEGYEALGTRRGGAQRVVGGLLIALGAAGGVGFGTYFGVEALLKNNQSNSGGLCGGTSGNACNAQGTQLRNTALMDATGSTVGAIVGSVVFTGGLVVLLSAPSGYQRKDSVSVAPWLDRNGGGVGMRGSW